MTLVPARLLRRARHLRASEFLGNVGRLAAGAGLAQVIALGSTPFLTRLYAPAQFGTVASYAAVLSFVVPLATLRLDASVVLPQEHDEAATAFWLTTGIATAVSAALAMLLAGAWACFPAVHRQPLGAFLLLVPLSVFLNATASTLSAWATRVRQFGALGRSGVVAALASLATSLTATRFAGTAEIGLLLGMLLGVAAGWATLLVTIARRGLFPPVRLPRVSECRAYLHKYRQFPLFALPMTVSDQFTSSLPVLLFSTLFSPATAAYFALANSSLRQPLSLVSQSTGQVFYERAARSQNEPAELLRLTRATVGALASLAVVPLLFVALIGPRMFALVFGAEWAPAGEYARLLMIAVAFTFVASPVSTLPSVLRKQHVHLGLAVLTAVARVAALWVGARTGKPTVAVALYSFAEALTISIFLGWLFTRLRRTGAPAPKPLSGASAPHVAQ